MIGILHGYLLEGSGSNLWTREIIRALCRNGDNVHLICQEPEPELYDFITQAYKYDINNNQIKFHEKKTDYPGKCIMHKPIIGDVLPVYVRDKYKEFKKAIPMPELNDDIINDYLNTNTRVISHIVKLYDIKVLHANHAVLMSVIAQNIYEKCNTPYSIMPHGSAIEYVVKKDKRFYNYAFDAFIKSKCVFTIGPEIQKRINVLFNNEVINNKLITLNLGVDSSNFKLVNKDDKNNAVLKLISSLTMEKSKKCNEYTYQFLNSINVESDNGLIKKRSLDYSNYDSKKPDCDIINKLNTIDWYNDKVIIYLGRIIGNKGPQTIISAMPQILNKNPKTKLLIVGHGPLREPLELLIYNLKNANHNMVKKIIRNANDWADTTEGEMTELISFFDVLETNNLLNEYYENAKKYLTDNNIIFTGYMTHKELKHLFPCCDIAIFPSLIVEAGPLVFYEAMASGCFPIGTYFGGIKANIDSLKDTIPEKHLNYMKIGPKKKDIVNDIINNIPNIFQLNGQYKSVLRTIAEQKYDWKNIAKRLKQNLLKNT